MNVNIFATVEIFDNNLDNIQPNQIWPYFVSWSLLNPFYYLIKVAILLTNHMNQRSKDIYCCKFIYHDRKYDAEML